MKLPTISKTKLKKAWKKQMENTRRELLVEKGEQVLDDLLVEKIMRTGKKTSES